MKRLISLAVLLLSATALARSEAPDVSHDGLHKVPDSKAAVAYVKPDVDFSVYERILILECPVAFRKNWQRDQNRGRASPSRRITDADVERIKTDMSDLFRNVFIEELDEKGGYEVTDAPASDVLLVRPAIIDLDVTAPDVDTSGRNYNFVASAGAATLYIELYDSVSGEILARAVDRRAADGYGYLKWATNTRNRAEARRLLRRWAGMLRDRLDEIHGR